MTDSVGVTAADLKHYVGKEVAVGPWVLVTQDMINRFADVTGDRQYIHVDVERAKESYFGGTIAHGFLTLSLLAGYLSEGIDAIDGQLRGKVDLNIGLRSVRFLAPVPTGSRIQVRIKLLDVVEGDRNQWVDVIKIHTVMLDQPPQPVMTAETIRRVYF